MAFFRKKYTDETCTMEDTTSICESVSSTSTHSSVLRMHNQELLITIHSLIDTFHHVKNAVVSMIEKPVEMIEKLTGSDRLTKKEDLRLSQDLLQNAIFPLIKGVKEMKKAMWTQNEALEKLKKCAEYIRLCDGENVSMLSSFDEIGNEGKTTYLF